MLHTVMGTSLEGDEEIVLDERLFVSSASVVETRYGPLYIPTNSDNDLILRFLRETGEWAFDEAAFVASTLPDNARVLDAGAFLGTFGLGIGLQKQIDWLCAVEANPSMLALLEANLQRCARSRFHVIGGLLARSNAPPRNGHADPDNLGSASFSEDASGKKDVPAPATTVTLAELRETQGPFELIKLDLEGMEREVLLGDAEYLSRGGTALWIECNESARSLEILDLVLSWGVKIYYFAFPSHNPNNFGGLAKAILPWAYEAGLLVAPHRTPVLTPELVAHGCILRQVTSRVELEEAMWLTPRWLPGELADADAPTLAAVASRALRGQDRQTFLRAGSETSVWERLAATREGLSHSEDLALSRLAEIESERRLRANAEARLADMVSLALERLGQIGEERDRADTAEAAAKTAIEANSAEVAAVQAQLAAIRTSLGWRLLARVNGLVERRPILHRALRRGRAVAGNLLGRR